MRYREQLQPKKGHLFIHYYPSGSITRSIPITIKQERRLAADGTIESVVYAVGAHII
jgi:hypothetical protein